MTATELDYRIRQLKASEVFPGEELSDQINPLVRVLSSTADELTPNQIWGTLQKPGVVIFVAEEVETGRIIGMATLTVSQQLLSGKAWLEDVAVLPEYGGRGIGRALTVAVILVAKRRNIKKLDLTSSNYRDAAHGLYGKLGWTERDSTLMRLVPAEFNEEDETLVPAGVLARIDLGLAA